MQQYAGNEQSYSARGEISEGIQYKPVFMPEPKRIAQLTGKPKSDLPVISKSSSRKEVSSGW